MNSLQVTSCQPSISVQNRARSLSLPSRPCRIPVFVGFSPMKVLKIDASALATKRCVHVLKYQRRTPVCLFGDKEKSGTEDGGSPWKSFEKAMGNFNKEKSIEDVLREQIEKQEYFDDGGKNKTPGGGGGGGGGGGDRSGGSSSGEPEDEGFKGIMDETVQVVLATIGFIFLYIYIITGEELTRLARDYIKYLFGGSKSNRLKRAMYQWGSFYEKYMKPKKIHRNWLEKEIINTSTWWDSPEKYRRALSPPAPSKPVRDEYDDFEPDEVESEDFF